MQNTLAILKCMAVGMALGLALLQVNATASAVTTYQAIDINSAISLPAAATVTARSTLQTQGHPTRRNLIQGAQSSSMSIISEDVAPAASAVPTQDWPNSAIHGLWVACLTAGGFLLGHKIAGIFWKSEGERRSLCGSQDMAMMATYSLKLITPDGEKVIQCRDDQYILDAADEAGLDLPYSCRTGSCSTCACKLVSGDVDQGDQAFLNETQQAEGLFVICQTTPKSDCVIKTHQEDEVWNFMR